VTRARLPSPGVAPALPSYFPDPSGSGIRVGGIRAEGAEVSGAQVVIADQLELALPSKREEQVRRHRLAAPPRIMQDPATGEWRDAPVEHGALP
jgi:hypothetical protein